MRAYGLGDAGYNGLPGSKGESGQPGNSQIKRIQWMIRDLMHNVINK